MNPSDEKHNPLQRGQIAADDDEAKLSKLPDLVPDKELTPHLTPCHTTPIVNAEHSRSTASLQHLTYEDPDEPDYEWIRLPKLRAYDLFQVPRSAPEDRGNANVLLHVTRQDGSRAAMWAKMDTGAEENLINLSTVKKILSPEGAHKALHALTLNEQYNLVGGNGFTATHTVSLSFHAGRSHKFFQDVRFVVYANQDESVSSADRVPDVLLGYPTLREHHMVMVDLDFYEEEGADADLVILAPMAESEGAECKSIGAVIKVKHAAPGIGPKPK